MAVITRDVDVACRHDDFTGTPDAAYSHFQVQHAVGALLIAWGGEPGEHPRVTTVDELARDITNEHYTGDKGFDHVAWIQTGGPDIEAQHCTVKTVQNEQTEHYAYQLHAIVDDRTEETVAMLYTSVQDC